jgi:hypothetical protein
MILTDVPHGNNSSRNLQTSIQIVCSDPSYYGASFEGFFLTLMVFHWRYLIAQQGRWHMTKYRHTAPGAGVVEMTCLD